MMSSYEVACAHILQDDVRDVLNYCTFSLSLLKLFQKSEREQKWRGGGGREEKEEEGERERGRGGGEK